MSLWSLKQEYKNKNIFGSLSYTGSYWENTTKLIKNLTIRNGKKNKC